MTKKCIGCGCVLQTEDENKNGYIIKEKYEDALLCTRCFQIEHYNRVDLMSAPKNGNDITKIVNRANGVALFLIDFLNINSETIKTYKNIKIPKILVISKSDIIPNSIKETKIIDWLRDVYDIQEEITFLSTNKKKNINLVDRVSTIYDNIYLLGFTNAGKSSYLNYLLDTKMDNSLKITTSMIPNTTLDFIKIRINENLSIIDSPGFTYKHTFYKDDVNLIKKINPKRFISPITYQTKEITSIDIEDRLIISLNSVNSITTYMSNDINISKIYNTCKFNELVKVKLDIPDNTDIVIKGVGFLNVKKACKAEILCESKGLVEIRKSLFSD